MKSEVVISRPISIGKLKYEFSKRFPGSELSMVLSRLPDNVPDTELPTYVSMWLAIIDAEAEK